MWYQYSFMWDSHLCNTLWYASVSIAPLIKCWRSAAVPQAPLQIYSSCRNVEKLLLWYVISTTAGSTIKPDAEGKNRSFGHQIHRTFANHNFNATRIPAEAKRSPVKDRSDRLYDSPNLVVNGYGGTFRRVKWQQRKAGHSPPSSTEVKNEWSYTSSPLNFSWRRQRQ
jgi:hypothetical protein